MPALLEVQRLMRAQMVEGAGDAANALFVGEDWRSCLQIYRATYQSTLIQALRLSFPVLARLVGADFFEAAALQFVATQRPSAAYLNEFGAAFAPFLREFAPAAAVPYLPDVAQLEWAVNRALHAEDVAAMDLSRLCNIEAAQWPQLCLVAHPSVSLLQLQTPADHIWRAVLEQNEAAMAAIDLKERAALLIERDQSGVQITRLSPAIFEFTQRLCAGEPLSAALPEAPDEQMHAALGEHLGRGRFIDAKIHDPLTSRGAFS